MSLIEPEDVWASTEVDLLPVDAPHGEVGSAPVSVKVPDRDVVEAKSGSAGGLNAISSMRPSRARYALTRPRR